MIVRLDNPQLLPALMNFLRLRVDCGVDQISSDQLNVVLLGSYREDAMRAELESRLRRWQVAQAGVQVEVLDEADACVVPFPEVTDFSLLGAMRGSGTSGPRQPLRSAGSGPS